MLDSCIKHHVYILRSHALRLHPHPHSPPFPPSSSPRPFPPFLPPLSSFPAFRPPSSASRSNSPSFYLVRAIHVCPTRSAPFSDQTDSASSPSKKEVNWIVNFAFRPAPCISASFIRESKRTELLLSSLEGGSDQRCQGAAQSFEFS